MNEDSMRVFQAFAATLDRLQRMHAAVMLRPKDVCPETSFDGDYDLLFDPDRFSEILGIAAGECRPYGVSMVVDQRKSYLKRIFFISDEDVDQPITLELWPHAEMTIPNRLLRAIATVDWDSARLFFVSDKRYLGLRPDVSAAIYITHLYHKQKSLNSPEVRRRLSLYRKALSNSADTIHSDLCGIIDSLGTPTADLENANMQAYSILLKMGARVRIRRILPLMQRTRRRLTRIMGSTRNVFSPVPVIGPDGSGKTALINALADREKLAVLKFRKVFKRSLPYWSYHFVQKKFGRTPYFRKMVDESVLHLIWATAVIRWWPFTTVGLARSYIGGRVTNTTVVDRHFWDFLLRLRDAGVPPARIAGYRVLSKLVPTPRRAVVLCCSSETIHSRKTELTGAAIDYLYELYWDQIARKKVESVLMLSTDGPFERSYRQIARFLLPGRTLGSRQSAGRDQAWGSGAGTGLVGAEGRGAAHRPSEAGV